ncbi:unnamed protein product [Mytilus coruscus]|uniref:Uncharacterized protein n=1 Tax=Mytilus coruscus TaxID=42192 RepID=A0A6J8D6G3_MYTCO|nr:unnamed protein product [Mytilus coruscus]
MVTEDYIWMVLVILCFVDVLSASGCKWSNEGCFSNSECCSNSCSLKHPGTEPRCEKSSILSPCLYNYHCERNYICGPKNKCCSDYWNDCRDETECCDPAHDKTYKSNVMKTHRTNQMLSGHTEQIKIYQYPLYKIKVTRTDRKDQMLSGHTVEIKCYQDAQYK